MATPSANRGILGCALSYATPAIAAVVIVSAVAATGSTAGAGSSGAGLTPALTNSSARLPMSLKDDVNAAKRQLAAASQVVQAADDAVDAASKKLPAANAAVSRAEAAVVLANRAVAVANQAVAVARQAQQAAAAVAAAAQVKVDAQRAQVRIAQAQVDAVKLQIAMIARRAYVSGNDSSELAIVLSSQSPGAFVEQLASLNRVSQGNSVLFDSLTKKQAALAATLVKLKELESAAAAREQDAQDRATEQQAKAQTVIDRARDVQQAREGAQARKQEVVTLIAAREATQAVALKQRGKLKRTYESLQSKLLANNGMVRSTGTRRNAKEAIAWGMKWLGSGARYDGLCLGFADDMYGVLPGHTRYGSALDHWHAMRRQGKAHPGDSTPPIGAQVFWDIPGYPYGHVATYVGGGMLLTTSAFSGSRVGLRSNEWLNSRLGVQDLGWAEPYYP